MRTAMLLLTVLLGGCELERVYTRVQTEDGLAMQAPIEFVVRVRADPQAETVEWLEASRDAVGKEHMNIRKYGGLAVHNECEVFDDKNWACTITGVDGAPVEQPSMIDGRLSRFYWHDPRETYQVKWRARPLR